MAASRESHWGCRHTQAGVQYALDWLLKRQLEVLTIDDINVGLDCLFNSFKEAVLVRRLDLLTMVQTDVNAMDAQELREAAIQFAEAIFTNQAPMGDREGLVVQLKHDVLDYLAFQGKAPISVAPSEEEILTAWTQAIRGGDMGDSLCLQMLASRYNVQVLVFQPPHPDQLDKVVSGGRSLVPLVFDASNKQFSVAAALFHTFVDVAHFEPVLGVPHASKEDKRVGLQPARFLKKSLTVKNVRDGAKDPGTGMAFESSAARARVRFLLLHLRTQPVQGTRDNNGVFYRRRRS